MERSGEAERRRSGAVGRGRTVRRWRKTEGRGGGGRGERVEGIGAGIWRGDDDGGEMAKGKAQECVDVGEIVKSEG